MPLIEVGGQPFLFTDSSIPGVSSLAVQRDILYFSSPCAEGIYSLPIAALFDDREPWERAEDICLVSAKPDNVAVEQLMGLSFRPSHPNEPFLYAADSLQLKMIRINVLNGRREVIADDPALFNFPSSASFLPPIDGMSPLLVVSNQQHLLRITNDAIAEDKPILPFIVTKVALKNSHGLK
ncbi:MAG: hypothetical protein D3923_10980 [Candidatus Electrothrix sp. AR3]|nr:hypothetical protein [Candidatus Electrothrix sp. AR3]